MSKWQKVKLKELLSIRNGKDHKSLQNGIYPVYGSGGIMRYANNYIYDKESILLPRKGTLNNIQFATFPFWTIDTCYYTEIYRDKVIPYFLYRYLSMLNIAALNTGSAIPSMTFDRYYSIEVLLPPIDTQRRIADILSRYDALIENYQKQIKLLEEAAQRLYKEWFVDLRFPGYENTKIVDGVPEGWKKSKLGYIAEFKRGKNITKKEAVDGTIPVVAGGLEPAYYCNKSNTAERVITISGSGANAGYVKLYFQKIWASDCSFVDKTNTIFLYFVYCYLKNNKITLDNMQKGAAQPHVYAKDINTLDLFIPTNNILESFEKITSKIFNIIASLQSQIRLLHEVRDRLLPKLMNGEITI